MQNKRLPNGIGGVEADNTGTIWKAVASPIGAGAVRAGGICSPLAIRMRIRKL